MDPQEPVYRLILTEGAEILKISGGRARTCRLRCNADLTEITWGTSSANAAHLRDVVIGRNDSSHPKENSGVFGLVFPDQIVEFMPIPKPGCNPLLERARWVDSYNYLRSLHQQPSIQEAPEEEKGESDGEEEQGQQGKMENYERKLGEGALGVVFLTQFKGHPVAVKIFPNAHDNLVHTVRELCAVHHPHIVRYHAAWRSGNDVNVRMAFCDMGSILDTMLSWGVRLSEEQIACVVRSVLLGLSHLHSKGIVHGDVKGGNILVGENGQVAISDFGVSTPLAQGPAPGERLTEESCARFAGSLLWMAPEVFDGRPSVKSDVWSLGVTLLELAEGELPHQDAPTLLHAIQQIREGASPSLSTSGWSSEFQDFVKWCLVKDGRKRPYVEQLLTHPFCGGDAVPVLLQRTTQSPRVHSPSTATTATATAAPTTTTATATAIPTDRQTRSQAAAAKDVVISAGNNMNIPLTPRTPRTIGAPFATASRTPHRATTTITPNCPGSARQPLLPPSALALLNSNIRSKGYGDENGDDAEEGAMNGGEGSNSSEVGSEGSEGLILPRSIAQQLAATSGSSSSSGSSSVVSNGGSQSSSTAELPTPRRTTAVLTRSAAKRLRRTPSSHHPSNGAGSSSSSSSSSNNVHNNNNSTLGVKGAQEVDDETEISCSIRQVRNLARQVGIPLVKTKQLLRLLAKHHSVGGVDSSLDESDAPPSPTIPPTGEFGLGAFGSLSLLPDTTNTINIINNHHHHQQHSQQSSRSQSGSNSRSHSQYGSPALLPTTSPILMPMPMPPLLTTVSPAPSRPSSRPSSRPPSRPPSRPHSRPPSRANSGKKHRRTEALPLPPPLSTHASAPASTSSSFEASNNNSLQENDVPNITMMMNQEEELGNALAVFQDSVSALSAVREIDMQMMRQETKSNTSDVLKTVIIVAATVLSDLMVPSTELGGTISGLGGANGGLSSSSSTAGSAVLLQSGSSGSSSGNAVGSTLTSSSGIANTAAIAQAGTRLLRSTKPKVAPARHWRAAQGLMQQPRFLSLCKAISPSDVTAPLILRLRHFAQLTDAAMTPDHVSKVSKAASVLWNWARCLYRYGVLLHGFPEDREENALTIGVTKKRAQSRPLTRQHSQPSSRATSPQPQKLSSSGSGVVITQQPGKVPVGLTKPKPVPVVVETLVTPATTRTQKRPSLLPLLPLDATRMSPTASDLLTSLNPANLEDISPTNEGHSKRKKSFWGLPPPPGTNSNFAAKPGPPNKAGGSFPAPFVTSFPKRYSITTRASITTDRESMSNIMAARRTSVNTGVLF